MALFPAVPARSPFVPALATRARALTLLGLAGLIWAVPANADPGADAGRCLRKADLKSTLAKDAAEDLKYTTNSGDGCLYSSGKPVTPDQFQTALSRQNKAATTKAAAAIQCALDDLQQRSQSPDVAGAVSNVKQKLESWEGSPPSQQDATVDIQSELDDTAQARSSAQGGSKSASESESLVDILLTRDEENGQILFCEKFSRSSNGKNTLSDQNLIIVDDGGKVAGSSVYSKVASCLPGAVAGTQCQSSGGGLLGLFGKVFHECADPKHRPLSTERDARLAEAKRANAAAAQQGADTAAAAKKQDSQITANAAQAQQSASFQSAAAVKAAGGSKAALDQTFNGGAQSANPGTASNPGQNAGASVGSGRATQGPLSNDAAARADAKYGSSIDAPPPPAQEPTNDSSKLPLAAGGLAVAGASAAYVFGKSKSDD